MPHEQGPLEVGLIGATAIARRAVLAPSRRHDDVVVRAVAASDPVRAREFALDNGIDRVHGSYADLVADPDLDLVYVSLHNSAHHEWAVAAASAGKHVVVEKPLCLTAAQAVSLRAAAAGSGVSVFEAIPTAGHPWQAAVREMVEDGRHGPLRGMSTAVRFGPPEPGSYRERPELGGGIFLDSASYWLQAVQAIIGLRGAELGGESAFDGPHGADRAFDATLRLPGHSALFHCELGDRHQAEHEFRFAAATVRVRDFLRPTVAALPLNLVTRRTADGARTVRSFEPVSYYDRQFDAILATLASGRPPNLADAVERVEVMAAILQRAKESAWSA